MALTSSIYRMAPSDGIWSEEDRQRRMKRMLQRLVNKHGQEVVQEKIKLYTVAKDQENLKRWLLSTAFFTKRRFDGA